MGGNNQNTMDTVVVYGYTWNFNPATSSFRLGSGAGSHPDWPASGAGGTNANNLSLVDLVTSFFDAVEFDDSLSIEQITLIAQTLANLLISEAMDDPSVGGQYQLMSFMDTFGSQGVKLRFEVGTFDELVNGRVKFAEIERPETDTPGQYAPGDTLIIRVDFDNHLRSIDMVSSIVHELFHAAGYDDEIGIGFYQVPIAQIVADMPGFILDPDPSTYY